MTPAAAQLAFGAETVAALAAATGLALVVLRSRIEGRRRPGAVLLAAGFALLTAAAVASGASLVGGPDHPAVVGPRLLGALAVAGLALRWDPTGSVRLPLVVGAFATASSVPAAVGDERAGSALLALGGGAVLVGLASAARTSLATRIAVGVGVTLLTLVLALAVALSAVLDANLRREAERRLEVRAGAESRAVNRALANALQMAYLVSGNLQVSPGLARLQAIAATRQPDRSLDNALALRSRILQGQALVFVGPDEPVVLGQAGTTTPAVSASELALLMGSEPVVATDCITQAGTGIVVRRPRAFGLAVVAVCSNDRTVHAGRLVTIVHLDDAYLNAQQGQDTSVSLSLVGPEGVVAASRGPQPDPVELRRLADTVLERGESRTAVFDRSFVAAAPVRLDPRRTPSLAVVTSTPIETIAVTRSRLDRVLFAIALVGALLALLLAAAFGERMGTRLRRLTVAALALGRGDPGVRASVAGEDEVGTLGATFDDMAAAIEEKTEVEARLRERIEAVVAGMGEALVAVDGEGRITDFNAAAEDLAGCSAATAVGRDVTEVLVLGADDGTDLQPRLKRPPRQRWTAAATLTPLEGADVPVAVSGGPLLGRDGAPAGGVFVLRDLRGEREVERMKNEFLSRVSHELRTPLTAVVGYAELLQARQFPADRTAVMLQEISSSASRLQRIVELLEFFAADAAGRRVLRPAPADLREIIEAAVAQASQDLPPEVTIARRLARNLPRVEADERWLRAALRELVDNAVKFSPGGGRVVVSAGPTADGRVEVSVTDRGIGMAPAEVERAFADFEQADTSDTRRYGGLGLGLPLVRRVAEGHGGEVRCESTPGRGTKVTLLLTPLAARRRARTRS